MKIGSTFKYSYEDTNGSHHGTAFLTSNILDESVLSDDQVIARFAEELQICPRETLKASGFILAARFILKKCPNATNILVEEDNSGNSDGGAGVALMFLVILAFIVAVFVFPLLVILGMHNKFLLKKFYNKYDGEDFKDFTKKYTYIGIGLYALVAVMIILDKVTNLALSGPAFSILLFGGIAYFVISLLLIKKNYAPEGEKLNIIETLKETFKKKEK